MTRSTSARIFSNGSPCSGGCDGSAARFYFSPIIRDPVCQPMQLLPENLRRSVTEFVTHQLIAAAAVTGGSIPNRSAASDDGGYNGSVGRTYHSQKAKPKLKWNAPKSSCSRG